MIYEYDWDTDLSDSNKELISSDYMTLEDIRYFIKNKGYNIKRGQFKNYLILFGGIYVVSSNDVRKGKYINRFDLHYNLYTRAGVLIIHKIKNYVDIVELRIHRDVVNKLLESEDMMKLILKQPTKIKYYGGN